MEEVIRLAERHPIISAIIIFFVIMTFMIKRDDKRKYNSAKDWNNNASKDCKGYVNRENNRKLQEKNDSYIALIIVVGFVVFVLYKWLM